MQPDELQNIVEIIEDWYLDWKDKIVDKPIPHKLGFAKEQLKQRIQEGL